MPKILIWIFVFAMMVSQVEVDPTLIGLGYEAIKFFSQLVVLVIGPYIAYKIRKSEEDRKEQALKTDAQGSTIMAKLDKNTDITVKTSEKVIDVAASVAAGGGVESEEIKKQNSEYFEKLLREYKIETHPERHLSEHQQESSQEKEIEKGRRKADEDIP